MVKSIEKAFIGNKVTLLALGCARNRRSYNNLIDILQCRRLDAEVEVALAKQTAFSLQGYTLNLCRTILVGDIQLGALVGAIARNKSERNNHH